MPRVSPINKRLMMECIEFLSERDAKKSYIVFGTSERNFDPNYYRVKQNYCSHPNETSEGFHTLYTTIQHAIYVEKKYMQKWVYFIICQVDFGFGLVYRKLAIWNIDVRDVDEMWEKKRLMYMKKNAENLFALLPIDIIKIIHKLAF